MKDVRNIFSHICKRKDKDGSPNHLSLKTNVARRLCFGATNKESLTDSVDALKFFLILFICLISVPYFFVQQQTGTAVLPLNSVLNLQISANFQMPISAMSVFNTIVLLIASLILSAIVTRFPILIGYIIMGFATVYFAGLESMRLRDVSLRGFFLQKVANKTYRASLISVFWQSPNYILIGLSEWFVILNTMEIIISYAPTKIKTLSMGLIYAANGTAFLMGSIITKVASATLGQVKWLSDDVNEGHWDYYFYVLAAFIFMFCLIITLIMRWINRLMMDINTLQRALQQYDKQPHEKVYEFNIQNGKGSNEISKF
ncbi:hypothetical protein Ciccas_013029 [Cichlidogyrus casuarinus]|uniref:Uncharacterized protein n=1 Tax=Cichlidogyrus casuarinus TaxID=1844966 RepID=A0ABD2PMF0_9PLAT